MNIKPPSARQLLAQRLGEKVSEMQLCSPYGGYQGLSRHGKRPYYAVLFSYPRSLDGVISVYSEKYICINVQTAYRFLPNKFTVVFESEQDAVDFLQAAFVEHDEEKTDQIMEKAKV